METKTLLEHFRGFLGFSVKRAFGLSFRQCLLLSRIEVSNCDRKVIVSSILFFLIIF